MPLMKSSIGIYQCRHVSAWLGRSTCLGAGAFRVGGWRGCVLLETATPEPMSLKCSRRIRVRVSGFARGCGTPPPPPPLSRAT